MYRSRLARIAASITAAGIITLGMAVPAEATGHGGGPVATIVKPPVTTWKPPSGINPNYYDEHGPMAGHKIQVENHLGDSAGWYPSLNRLYEWNDDTDNWSNLLNLEVLPVGVKCQYHGWTCIKLFAVDDRHGESSWISHWGPWERDVTLNTYLYDHGINPDAKLDAGRQLCRRFANALGLGVGRGHDRDKGGSCMNTAQVPTGRWWITDLDHQLIAGAYPLGKGGR